MLKEGMKAPDFSLPDQDGKTRTLSEFAGKKVVLYFYSKDMTAGCAKQAAGFAALYARFAQKNAVVIGVSKDSSASHKKFAEKYALPFVLLADTERQAIEAYDVWQQKMNYGKPTMGVVRTTYVIDENGVIVKAMGKVKAADNPAQTLELL
jgi:peroxiredoxin Q/BCP